jgi:hypothetical protein
MVVDLVLRLVGRSATFILLQRQPLNHLSGYWAALAFAYVLPGLIRYTLGVVAIGLRKYIGWLSALRRYVNTISTLSCEILLK